MTIRPLTIATLVAIPTLLVVAATPLMAQDKGPHDGAIKARQGMFQLYGFNLGMLGAMAKGEMDYDAELAAGAAKNLDLATQLDQSAMWPAGSDNEGAENAENRALPGIWENQDDVMSKFEDLRTAVADLQSVAGEGVDGLKSAVGDVGNTCKSCHDDYREEKD